MPRKEIVEDGKKTRFKKGDKRASDAGKKGSPEGKRVSTILKELLSKDPSTFGLKTPNAKTTNQALAIELLKTALEEKNKDKLSAIKEILDRTEGRSQQNIDVTSGGDSLKPTPIKFDE